MKSVLTLTLLILSLQTFAQNWQPIGLQGIGNVSDIAEYNGDLYITGSFVEIAGDTVNHVARWDGSSWVSVGDGIQEFGYGTCMEVYDNELYVAGYFDEVDGIPANGIAKWNGSSWSAVQNGLDMMLAANDMHTMNNQLYIGGSPDLACNTPLVNMVSWNGSSFNTVGTGELRYLASTLVSGTVYSLAENGGELYAGGIFDHVDGQTCEGVLRWDGTNWNALPSGLPTTQTIAIGFVGGSLICSQNNNTVHRLSGTTWSTYPTSWPGSPPIYSIFEFNGVPILGGNPNSMPYAYTGAWNILGSLPNIPRLNTFRNIGGVLHAVGKQGVLIGGSVIYSTLVVQWLGPLWVPDMKDLPFATYPNPSNGVFQVDGNFEPTAYYSVFDSQGRTVSSGMLGRGALDMRELMPGHYMIRIVDGDRTGTRRLVME